MHTCAFCKKTAPETPHVVGDRTYHTTPPSWFVWQDWCGSECFGERLVCSTACADALEVKERAEIEAANY